MRLTVFQRQAELPASIQLFRYTPERLQFPWESWDPTKVRTAKDLPQYLILGPLDESTFNITSEGWSAVWQGTEHDTYFKIRYLTAQAMYVMHQNWCGVDGGTSMYRARMPLGNLIAETLYMWFPWDRVAKNSLEEKYQLTYFEQPKKFPTICGIPDGTFRTVAFPVAIKNLRHIQDRLNIITSHSRLNYPIKAKAKLLFQAINYVQGKAPTWTTNEPVVFAHSIDQIGIVPHGFPVKETADDGSSSWTLRRDVYVLFISVPFAGLTDFLERMVTAIDNGPIRLKGSEPLPVQLQPIVIPQMFEHMYQNIAFGDKELTTRCSWFFFKPGETPPTPSIEDFIHGEAVADDLLLKAESISAEVTEEVQQLLNKLLKKQVSSEKNSTEQSPQEKFVKDLESRGIKVNVFSKEALHQRQNDNLKPGEWPKE